MKRRMFRRAAAPLLLACAVPLAASVIVFLADILPGAVAARRAERTAVSIETAKYIERNIPNFEVLNEEALQIIETNAEAVLAEIGVNFVDTLTPRLTRRCPPNRP